MTVLDSQPSRDWTYHRCVWMDYQGQMQEARLVDISLRSATEDEIDMINAESDAMFDGLEATEDVFRRLTGGPMKG